MALNEACQIWVEQRITEELAERGDSGKSLRAIGREIERIFEAKVSPHTMRNRVTRKLHDSNESPPETAQPATVESGYIGDKLTPENHSSEHGSSGLTGRAKSAYSIRLNGFPPTVRPRNPNA